MSIRKLAPLGVLALAFAFAPAQAGPAQTATPIAASIAQAQAQAKAEDGGAVTEVRWRRRGWGGGALIGLGAGVVVGSIIANEAYRPRRGYYYDDYAYDGPYYRPSGYGGDPRTICAENFRSFEWRTGLYTTYSGEKRVCPYLR